VLLDDFALERGAQHEHTFCARVRLRAERAQRLKGGSELRLTVAELRFGLQVAALRHDAVPKQPARALEVAGGHVAGELSLERARLGRAELRAVEQHERISS
jgi:hypothetical protein